MLKYENMSLDGSQQYTPVGVFNVCRCRERKKQKAADIEKAAEELSGRMEQYNLVQQKHKQLSDQQQALKQQLAEKEAELARVRASAAQVQFYHNSSLL